MKPGIVLVFVFGLVYCCIGQTNIDSLKAVVQTEKNDSNKIEILLQISKAYLAVDPPATIPYALQAKQLATGLNSQKSIALAYKYIGLAYSRQSKSVEALDNWNKSLEIFQKINDKAGISNILNNIGTIYKVQGNDTRAQEFFFQSLQYAEESRDVFRTATALQNIGSVYQNKSATYDKALEYFLRALPLATKLGDNQMLGYINGNIGEIYLQRYNADSAMYYFKKQEIAFASTVDIAYALFNIGRVYEIRKVYDTARIFQQQAYDSAKVNGAKLYMVQIGTELAKIEMKGAQFNAALEKYHQAEKLAIELQSIYELKDIYTGLARAYSSIRDYPNASKYQSLLLDIKDSIYNKEADAKLAGYELNFEMEKKQSQIDLLDKNNQLQEANIKRQKFAKNAFIGGFGLIMVLAIVLYRNYRNKVKVNLLLDAQNAQIEHLLQNILPVEVANELQVNGTATPRFYESVSVLFTDFKGFTKIADGLSPQEVVTELNDCFMAFDDIIGKYGLEKIKTIGDSYMCAGGIPLEKEGHVANMVRAGVEIQDYILARNQRRQDQGLEPWAIRIGVHVGPVVAGVVGKKKYAYDIWGSTVNVASRMESNGEPGRVNISEAVYRTINGNFVCTYRGKISAKNIGEIDMFFVEHEVVSLS